MRGLAIAMTATAFLAGACGVQSSSLDPNSTVTVSGKAMDADGQPLANAKVVLVKELDLGEAVGGLFVTAVTLGLACIADNPPALCAQNAHLGKTDASGAYTFSVKAGQTTGSFGLASTMEVVIGGSSGASLAEFTFQTTSLTLPDLRLWRPTAGFAPDGRSTWSALPSSYGDRPAYTVELYDQHRNQWWVTAPMKSGDRIDGRVLEDLDGTADVAARAHGAASGTTVDFTYTSASVALHGSAGAPPSRGAPCAPVVSGKVGEIDTACALTSGRLDRHLPASFGAASQVVVDLGDDRGLSLVVVKGCTAQCTVSISSDESNWTPVATLSGPYAVAPITLNRLGRYVAVSEPNASGLRQISIW